MRRLEQYARQSFRCACALVLLLASGIAAAAAPARVLVYGDSLSAAYGFDQRQGWPALLQTELQKDAVVVNASISGETTRGGAARIAADLARHQPTVVILALGANDGLRGLPLAEARRNLESMITLCEKAGARVILAGIQIPPNYGIDYAKGFQAMYPELARARKAMLIPFLLEGIADKLEYFQADRLHPTAAAQPLILANVLPVVRKALAKRNSK